MDKWNLQGDSKCFCEWGEKNQKHLHKMGDELWIGELTECIRYCKKDKMHNNSVGLTKGAGFKIWLQQFRSCETKNFMVLINI